MSDKNKIQSTNENKGKSRQDGIHGGKDLRPTPQPPKPDDKKKK